jgi:SAM-dependent methyltransferase
MPGPVDAKRRLSFGGVADLYDRRRPSYPAALISDVLVAAASPSRALEVGAGTGKATVLFAARGVGVDALEPSAEMAAFARVNTGRFPAVRVTEAEFESWRRADEPYPLLFSAQAWHWVQPAVRYQRAREALVPGGVLAAFWNRVDWPQCRLAEPLARAYDRRAPELLADDPMRPSVERQREPWDDWTAEVEAGREFAEPELRSYRWVTEYSAGEYVELLRTHSDYIVLEPARREALLAAIGAAIETSGGVLELPLVTRLCLARARAR